MQYARFGNTAMNVSRLCLGTMHFGSDHLDPDACARVVDEAIDNGVNFIDTAEGYGPSEGILGPIVSGKRDRVFISTKVFSLHTHDDHCGRNSRHNILKSCEDSLAKLKTDYIDLYLLHHPDPDTPLEETVQILDELVRDGKVRYFGCSNHYAWQMALMLGCAARHGWRPVVTNQVCYNIIDRPAEVEFVPFGKKMNVPIMAYSPLSGGLLTGKYERGQPLPEDSAIKTRFGGKLERMHETNDVHHVLDRLRPIAAEHQVSLAQLSLMWLLAKPAAGTVIVGGSRPEHFTPAYEIADRELAPEVVECIDALSERQVYKYFRNQPFTDGPGMAPGI